jgi:hypothetical protein
MSKAYSYSFKELRIQGRKMQIKMLISIKAEGTTIHTQTQFKKSNE